MLEMNLTDEELELMLITLAEKHVILFMQRKETKELETLISRFVDGLKKIDKEHIFFKVFNAC